MLILGGLFLILCVLAIVASRRVRSRRMVGVVARAALVAFATWAIWSVLLVSGVVRVDPLLEWFGAYRLEQPWAAVLFLAPAVVVAVVFGLFAVSRMTDRGGPRGEDNERGREIPVP